MFFSNENRSVVPHVSSHRSMFQLQIAVFVYLAVQTEEILDSSKGDVKKKSLILSCNCANMQKKVNFAQGQILFCRVRRQSFAQMGIWFFVKENVICGLLKPLI